MTTTLASAALANIKAKFTAVGLKERVETCPFKQFFIASEIKSSRQIIHQLLLRKARSNDKAEMQFLIVSQNLRFDLIEFTFITGLKFDQYPTHTVLTEMSRSKRLQQTYLNGDASLKLGELEAAFLNYVDIEDCWKLGLCYFVEAVLLADEPWSKVNIDLLSYVEDEEFFFSISLRYGLLSQDSQGS